MNVHGLDQEGFVVRIDPFQGERLQVPDAGPFSGIHFHGNAGAAIPVEQQAGEFLVAGAGRAAEGDDEFEAFRAGIPGTGAILVQCFLKFRQGRRVEALA